MINKIYFTNALCYSLNITYFTLSFICVITYQLSLKSLSMPILQSRSGDYRSDSPSSNKCIVLMLTLYISPSFINFQLFHQNLETALPNYQSNLLTRVIHWYSHYMRFDPPLLIHDSKGKITEIPLSHVLFLNTINSTLINSFSIILKMCAQLINFLIDNSSESILIL